MMDPDGESPSLRPAMKRPCVQATPEAFRTKSATSTPKSCARTLNFSAFSREIEAPAPAVIKVENLPDCFIQSNFPKFLGKLMTRRKIGSGQSVVRCYNYNRVQHSILVELISQEVARSLAEITDVKFMNASVHFTVEEPVEDIYSEDTITDVQESMEENVDMNRSIHTVIVEEDSNRGPEEEGKTFRGPEKVLKVDDVEEEEFKGKSDRETAIIAQDSTMQDCEKVINENKPQTQLLFTNLPQNSDLEYLKFVVNRMCMELGFCDKGKDCITSITLKDSRTALVMCSEDYFAASLLELESFSFMGESVVVSSVVSQSPECIKVSSVENPLSQLLITNLPQNSDLEYLKFVVNRMCMELGFCDKGKDCITSITLKDSRTALVMCSEDYFAASLLELESFSFMGESVVVSSVVSQSPECIKVSSVENPLSQLLITNLPQNSDLEYLKFVVNKMCVELGLCDKGKDCVTSIALKGTTSAVIKCSEEKCATALKCLESFPFMGSSVLVKEYCFKYGGEKKEYCADFEEVPDAEEETVVTEVRNSYFVKATNVPKSMSNDSVKGLVNSRMVEAGFCDRDDCCITEVLDAAASKLLKFRSCEEANLSTLLENVEAKGQKVVLRKYLPKEPSFSVPSAAEANVAITSKEGQIALLRKLIQHRNLFPKCGSHDLVLSHIQKALLALGICTTVADVRSQRKKFKDQYNRMLKEGRNGNTIFKILQIIFDGGDVKFVLGTEYDPAKDPPEGDLYLNNNNDKNELSDELAKFCKVAAWSNSAARELVSICIDNKDEFEKPVRHTHFWAKVSEQMCKKRLYYTAHQCELKLNKLVKLYKDYIENDKTGRPHPSLCGFGNDELKLYDSMRELLAGNVTVEPKVTCSSGFSTQLKIQEKPTGSNDTLFRVGSRERPLVLKGKQTKNERKLQASETKAQAMLIFAKTYAKKNGNSLVEDDSDSD